MCETCVPVLTPILHLFQKSHFFTTSDTNEMEASTNKKQHNPTKSHYRNEATNKTCKTNPFGTPKMEPTWEPKRSLRKPKITKKSKPTGMNKTQLKRNPAKNVRVHILSDFLIFLQTTQEQTILSPRGYPPKSQKPNKSSEILKLAKGAAWSLQNNYMTSQNQENLL